MAIGPSLASESRSLLSGVSWAVYRQLRDVPRNDRLRMTYHAGELEVMSPSHRHERYAHFIGRLIEAFTLERNIEIVGCRAMTFRREELQKGLEPDNCYYISCASQIRGRDDLDLAVDPPPDLVVEVEITHPAVEKLPLYAAFGVPEVWVFDGDNLRIFVLRRDGRYEPSDASRLLPGLHSTLVEEYLTRLWSEPESALMREFSAWARDA